jgi:subtilisin family serine protease
VSRGLAPRALITALGGSLILTASAAQASDAAGGQLTGRVLVSLRQTDGRHAAAAGATAFEARTGAQRAGPAVPQIGLVTVSLPPGTSFAAYARRLRSDPDVKAVSLERRFTLRFLPNDPALTAPESSLGTPAGIAVEWWPARENLPQAWDISRGDGATVALIDTGVDGGHPELSGKVAAAVNFDPNPADGPATTDRVGHGTHVASLACANSDDGKGLAGAGLNCRLIVEKSDLSDASVAQAIVDATDRGADAINMSFGTDGSTPAPQALVDAIDYAFAHNVVLAAAAADSSVTEQGDPANVLQPSGTGSDITQGKGLSVTSASFSDARSSFAGFGSEISIAAYGSFADTGGPAGIFGDYPHATTTLDTGSAVPPPPQPPCACRTVFQGDSGYAYLQGTSMAVPAVTAVGALVRHLNPDLRASEILGLIKSTARRAPGAGWTPDLGWGILDGGAALDAARHIDRRPPRSVLSGLPVRTRRGALVLHWTGTDPAPPNVIAPGIDHYEVWRSYDEHAPALLATTTATSLPVHLTHGHRYGFFVRAVDKAGLREPVPASYPRVAAVRRAATSRGRRLKPRLRGRTAAIAPVGSVRPAPLDRRLRAGA